MAGELFTGHPELEFLDLNDNVCIDEEATGRNRVQTLLSNITEKCGSGKNPKEGGFVNYFKNLFG